MPYKSDAQRKWAHTESAKKEGFPTEEFDQASKGKKLPEKSPNMADGGEVEDPYISDIGKSFSNEMANPLDKVKEYLMQLYNSDRFQHGNPDISPTFPGLQGVANQTAGIEGQDSPGQGYAQGGPVMSDEGANFLTRLNQGTAMTPQFDPTAGMPPTPPPVAPPMPVAPPNPMGQYLGAQRAQINKFGPEQQMAVSNDLIKQRQSLGAKAPVALGGFADALMQGVARAGNPGFAERIQGQQNRLAGEQTDALKNADTSNLAHVEATSKLDAMDPNSPVSKVAQQTWGALLAKNGFKPQQIAQMPASSIAALTGQTVEALKASAEAAMAKATLGLNTQKFHSEDEARKAAEKAKTEEQTLGAAKTLAGRGMFKKATDAIFGDPGTELLEKQISGGEASTPHGIPDLGSTFNGQKVKSVKRID